jgi:hypothetical protein
MSSAEDGKRTTDDDDNDRNHVGNLVHSFRGLLLTPNRVLFEPQVLASPYVLRDIQQTGSHQGERKAVFVGRRMTNALLSLSRWHDADDHSEA